MSCMVWWAKQIPTLPVSVFSHQQKQAALANASCILAPASLSLNWSFSAKLYRDNLQYYSRQLYTEMVETGMHVTWAAGSLDILR